MLTGDKQESAVQIARSSGMLKHENLIEVHLVSTDQDTLKQRIQSELKYVTLKELVR